MSIDGPAKIHYKPAAVRRALLPLLPLDRELRDLRGRSLLENLPSLFEAGQRDSEPVRRLVDAYLQQKDLFEALRAFVEDKR